MNETYNITALVLSRRPYRECDQIATLLTRESGKMVLLARGAKKINSKAAAHLEPLNIAEIMVIRGRKQDYAGGVSSISCFSGIKSSLAKTVFAGRAINTVDHLLKTGKSEPEAFGLLRQYLELLECLPENGIGEYGFLYNSFELKFLASQGYRPELGYCLHCKEKIKPQKNIFDANAGGLICINCLTLDKNIRGLNISPDCIKMLRFALANDLDKIVKIKASKKIQKEYSSIIGSFTKMYF